jgi:hypothetical protein
MSKLGGTMQIFNAEKLDGIAEVIEAKASITYAALAQPSDSALSQKMRDMKSIASLDDKDLYYVQSILVTSSWNKNDDVFDPKEIWIARDTPAHKPTNLEHDEHTIIGHITANWPMTDDGILIDNNTPVDNLPEKYHILTGSVIYTGFSDPALRDRAYKLISEIESGDKYVSMECYFKGFDYGLLNKTTGEYSVLSRGENTAYLTKYLRAYGGAGEHENYKIGRVLRQITFSGKGFVNKPANPESVIFTKDNMKDLESSKNSEIINLQKKTIFETIGVFSNQANLKENNMNSEVDTTASETVTNCDEMNASVASLTEKTTQLEAALAEAKAAVENLLAEKELAAKKAKEDEEAKEEENKNLKASLDAANEVIAAYKAKEEEMAKKEKKMKRAAALIESGIASEVAEATVEKFDSLDDASFEAMTSLLAAKKVKEEEEKNEVEDKKESKKEEDDEEEGEASEQADSSVLENVEVEQEIDLSVGGDASTEVESTRAALVDFVYHRLGKKLNKGE